MTDRPRRTGKLLCAALAACYGILVIGATGLHRHDLARAGARHHPLSSTSVSLDRFDVGQTSAPDVAPAGCWLCAWNRTTACPAWETGLEDAALPDHGARPPLEALIARASLPATVLLRAPPRA